MDNGLAFTFPASLQRVQAQGNTKTQRRLVLVKLDVWQRLRGVRYAIFQVDLARSLAAGHSPAISDSEWVHRRWCGRQVASFCSWASETSHAICWAINL